MSRNTIRFFFFILGVVAVTSACQKDIILNLKNAAGLLVIEGSITNQPGPYYVVIQTTRSFYDSNNVVPVSGASAVMTDNAGNRDSLYETGYPGLYLTSTIAGVVGRTYHLSVNVSGKEYDAYSTLNPPVPIDSIGAQTITLLGKEYWTVAIYFQDPPGGLHYYKAFCYQNGSAQNPITVDNDAHTGGLRMAEYVNPNFFFNLSDTVSAELDAIDLPMYTYYYTLNNSTLNATTIAPANPISNFSNNALGYFSAYSPSLSYSIVLDANGFHRI